MIAGYEHELGRFQLDIARRWFQRGEATADVDAKLFFSYTAFNALFFYWGMVDGLVKREKRVPEHVQIENLVKKLDDSLWDRLCKEASSAVSFFVRRDPIQKMDERDPQDPREGNRELGEAHRKTLRDPSRSNPDKLVALTKILYVVRCNLCHGSKGILGDDMTVIEWAVPLLRIITDEAILYTEARISNG